MAGLIKRAGAVTKHEIDCHYKVHDVEVGGQTKRVGLLFIPQRAAGKEPAQFLRNAPPDPKKASAYHTHDIYFRRGDECRPAETAADFNFLCSPERCILSSPVTKGYTTSLTNNLGQRDAGFIKFVGRENYLKQLWKWVCDSYSPAKLLSGQGGVGKTTLAREFAEDVIRSGPMNLEFLIWVSAKRRSYLATEAEYISTRKVDYNDTHTLLHKLLVELGNPSDLIDPESTKEELVQQMVETLKVMPSFLIIDDVDSLQPHEQQDVFHTMIQIADRTVGTCNVASRVLLTARLTLGAAPSQLIEVKGLEPSDFFEYIQVTAETMSLLWTIGEHSKLMKRFHTVTDGSPLFASSILRLVKLGFPLEKALTKWQDHDGEEVRAAAFGRELDQLTDSQIRSLYAASLLGETTFVELQTILDSGETLLRNNIAELHKYHLLAVGSEIPNSGTRLIVPNSLQVMQNVIRKRVRDSRKLEVEASRLRRKGTKTSIEGPRVLRTVSALWSQNDASGALETALWAEKQHPDDADLKCLLGRAYLRTSPPNPNQADIQFRRAYEVGCKRTELTSLWAQAKVMSEDWIGLLDITRLPNREFPMTEDLTLRAQSYFKLSEISIKASQLDGAATFCLTGVKEITDAFSSGKVPSYHGGLNEIRSRLLEHFVSIKDGIYTDADDHLYVWEACVDAYRLGLRTTALVELAAARLRSWWTAVERRSGFQANAKNKLKYHLQTAQTMLSWFRKHEPGHPSTIEILEICIEDLQIHSSNYIA